MTIVAPPISHLQENPLELAQQQLRTVADAFQIDPNLIRVLEQPKKAISVSIPVYMEAARADGHGPRRCPRGD